MNEEHIFGIFTLVVVAIIVAAGIYGYRHVNPILFVNPTSKMAKVMSAVDYIGNTIMVISGVMAIGFIVTFHLL